MSIESAGASSGIRFAADLKKIREEKGISLKQMHGLMRAPISVLQQFEETALLDNAMFNRVYLRSFVRSFANAVELAEDEALSALEAVFRGEYHGELLAEVDEYSDHEEDPARLSEEPVGGGRVPEHDRAEDLLEKASPLHPIVENESSGRAEDVSHPADESGAVTPVAMDSRSSVDTRRPSKMERKDERRTRPLARPKSRWPFYFFGALILVVVIVIVNQRGSAPGPTHTLIKPTPDTTLMQAQPIPPTPEPFVLADTLTVYVVADKRIDPIFVRVDNDLRRPYWIEKGDSSRFRFTDKIDVQSRRTLRWAHITLEGYLYPKTPADTLITITRDKAQSVLSSLSSALRLP